MTELQGQNLVCLCGKKLAEHSLKELCLCAGQDPERDAMDGFETVRVTYRGQTNCRICGKPIKGHSLEKDLLCAMAEERERLSSRCPICDRTFSEHSYEEMHACAVKDRDQRGKGPPAI